MYIAGLPPAQTVWRQCYRVWSLRGVCRPCRINDSICLVAFFTGHAGFVGLAGVNKA